MKITLTPKTVHNLQIMLKHHPEPVCRDELNAYAIFRMRWDDRNMIQMYSVSRQYDRTSSANSPWYTLTPFGLRCARAIPAGANGQRITVDVAPNGGPSKFVLSVSQGDKSGDEDTSPEPETDVHDADVVSVDYQTCPVCRQADVFRISRTESGQLVSGYCLQCDHTIIVWKCCRCPA